MKFKARKRIGKSLYIDDGQTHIRLSPAGKPETFMKPVIDPEIPLRPDWLVCDCCMNRVDRLWIRPHRAFCASYGSRIEFVEGFWAFCVYCHALFQAGEIVALAARAETLNPELASARGIYESLASSVYGEWQTWEAGQSRRFDKGERKDA